MHILKKVLTISAVSLLAAGAAHAQHINAGASSTNQGSQLYFVNGSNYVNTSGFVITATYTNGGTYAGYYQAGSPTFTALSGTNANGTINLSNSHAFGATGNAVHVYPAEPEQRGHRDARGRIVGPPDPRADAADRRSRLPVQPGV